MPFEMVVGLQVSDNDQYARYREAMSPILARFGGGFRYDFQVARVLKQQTAEPINRVFTIHFADRESKDCFFGDPEYQRVKEAFFINSVTATTIIAQYEIYT